MRIFKTAWFNRFARKNDIKDEALVALINDLEAGIFDADLGGGVFKKRLAREGEGKSGGYRTLICFRQNERAFFVFGFSKSAMGNISQRELADLKKLADTILTIEWEEIDEGIAKGKFFEVGVNDENVQE